MEDALKAAKQQFQSGSRPQPKWGRQRAVKTNSNNVPLWPSSSQCLAASRARAAQIHLRQQRSLNSSLNISCSQNQIHIQLQPGLCHFSPFKWDAPGYGLGLGLGLGKNCEKFVTEAFCLLSFALVTDTTRLAVKSSKHDVRGLIFPLFFQQPASHPASFPDSVCELYGCTIFYIFMHDAFNHVMHMIFSQPRGSTSWRVVLELHHTLHTFWLGLCLFCV